jgi:hypothetical protein
VRRRKGGVEGDEMWKKVGKRREEKDSTRIGNAKRQRRRARRGRRYMGERYWTAQVYLYLRRAGSRFAERKSGFLMVGTALGGK